MDIRNRSIRSVTKCDCVTMDIPKFNDDASKWSFIHTVFEDIGEVCDIQNEQPTVAFVSDNKSLLDAVREMVAIPADVSTDDGRLSWSGANCIDFLGTMYAHSTHLGTATKYSRFVQWQTEKTTWGICNNLPRCLIYRTEPSAIIPTKARPSDVGYDLSIIKEHKKLSENVSLYDTGIRIRVPYGMYAEVVPRSSLSKSGYMLANSVGIIDASYNGNIYVALAKIDPEAAPLAFPFRCCQIIMRRQMNVDMVEVDKMFDETHRGSGGFGSSG